MSTSPPPSTAGRGGDASYYLHRPSSQHPLAHPHHPDHDTVVQPIHPHHHYHPRAAPQPPPPVAFEPPVKTTASALSSPFMSISIANTKSALIATALTAAKLGNSGPASLEDKLAVVAHKDQPYSHKNDGGHDSMDEQQHRDSNNNHSRARTIPAPSYESSVGNIPTLDPLPPPPVYDIVNCSTSQTLLLVSSLINTIITVNDRLQCPKITLFHSRAIPNISIEAYLTRILQYAPFQNEVLLIILLYFDRIGGGCKPTQVLMNNIPKPLLLKAFGTHQSPFSSSHQAFESSTVSPVPSYASEKTPPAFTTSPTNVTARVPEGDSRLMDELMRQDGGAETDKESAKAAVIKQAKELEAKHHHNRRSSSKPLMPGSKLSADSEVPEEEEPIEDEIYTSSAESPIGSKLIINSFNIHRLLITSILVACKFSSDVFYPNVRYARVGGLPLSELNQLELEFLFLSQFELNATEAELQAYGNKLLMYQQRLASEKKMPLSGLIKESSVSPPPPHPSHVVTADLKDKSSVSISSVASRPSISEPAPGVPSPNVAEVPVLHAPVPTRSAPIHGSYRDSKEGIRQDYEDEDDEMSVKGDDSLMSPTESEVDLSVFKSPAPSAAPAAVESSAPRSQSRHRVMNLDSLVWPTNNMDNYRPSTNYFFGSMVKDEDAERIEQEFNRPSPPPEAQEHQKRKLQRLSSGSMETTPSKRTNPSNDKKSSKEGRTSTSSTNSSSSSNILKPFFRKIASLAHRSEPQSEEQPEPEAPSLRKHPYMVRPRVSPPPPAAPEPSSDDVTLNNSGSVSAWNRPAPLATASTTPSSQETSSSSSSWTRQRVAPPPYSGRTPQYASPYPSSEASSSRSSSTHSRNRTTARDYRRHRSREPSLSTLASELTFEPTTRRPSMSPSAEDEQPEIKTSQHPVTLAPFYFPSRPQPIDGTHHTRLSHQPAPPGITEDEDEDMPMAKEEEEEDARPSGAHRRDRQNSVSMQVDQISTTPASQQATPGTDKNRGALRHMPSSAAAATATTKMYPPAPATPAKSRSSSRRSSVSSNAMITSDARDQQQAFTSSAGRQWNPSHAATLPSTKSNPPSSPFPGVVVAAAGGHHPPPQVYHQPPHHGPYVASYYAPSPHTLPHNLQLYHDPVTMKSYPVMAAAAHPHPSVAHPVLVAMPPMSTMPMTAPATVQAHQAPSSATSSAATTKLPAALSLATTSSQSRPIKAIRQFASIRPRTPTVIAAEKEAAAAAAQATATTTPATKSEDKSGPSAKSTKKSLFGSSKKSAPSATRPAPPPPSRPPPPLPFMAAATPAAVGAAGAPSPYGPPPPIMAFAHAPPPHALAHHHPQALGTTATAAGAAGAPILIPLIPVMYNNVRPLPPPPHPHPIQPANNPQAPPALVKIAPKLPQS